MNGKVIVTKIDQVAETLPLKEEKKPQPKPILKKG